MDLNQAIEKHADWKLRFRNAIAKHETMDAAMIAKDNCCELGKWLHGEAKQKFSMLPSYTQCVAKHAAFHTEAGKIAQMINSGKYTDAEKMLAAGTSYAQASNAVGVSILALKKEAKL